MTVKKTSHAGKGLYKVYRDQLIFGKNKIKKLKRHLKKFPDDAVAQKALKEHSSGIHASPRWGHKDGSNLSAGRRLSEQLESNAKAAMNQLRYAQKAHADTAWVFNGQLVTDFK